MPLKYIVGIGLFIGAMLAAFVNPLFLLVIAGLFVAIFYLARNPEFGLILLVFFFPYLGLIVDFSTIDALREIPYVRDINAPFVDLYGVVFLCAWIFSFVARPPSVGDLATKTTLSVAKNVEDIVPKCLAGISGTRTRCTPSQTSALVATYRRRTKTVTSCPRLANRVASASTCVSTPPSR